MKSSSPLLLSATEREDLLRSALALPEEATPFPWQAGLLAEWVDGDDLPSALDVPTGLGKTSVLAVWLLARALGANVPRRLIYVVDRRAVVDQATTVAVGLRDWLGGEGRRVAQALGLGERGLLISTLRGQHVDNREWLEDPALPAIVVGTVDMVGSRLLFGGYGVSRKMRPYQAGLLGHDALIALDEAHLVPPFEALVRAISQRTGRLSGERGDELPPLRLLTLSATGRSREGRVFSLGKADLKHAEVRRRLDAPKELHVEDLESGQDLVEAVSDEAWRLGAEGGPARIVVFVDKRADAQAVYANLFKRAAAPKRAADDLADLELLVGERRVRERQCAAGRLEELGFLGGVSASGRPERPTFLIATAAGEVGVDLDADHMVSDLVAWERMVQRLGRVNRRGRGDAEVHVFARPLEGKESGGERRVYDAQRALMATLIDSGRQVGPGALLQLRDRASRDESLASALELATSPPPLRPPLEAATVEDWSMTSWEDHAGRPARGPWIRGWQDDEKPECRVVWRDAGVLPLLCVEASNSRRQGKESKSDWIAAPDRDVENYFEAAPPHLSEVLEAETWRVVSWLQARVKRLWMSHRAAVKKEQRALSEPRGDQVTDAAATDVRLSPEQPLGFVLDSSGRYEEALPTLREWSKALKNKPARDRLERALAGRTLVLDARLGGLDGGGLLADATDEVVVTVCDEEWLPLLKEGGRYVPAVRFKLEQVARSAEAESERLQDWRVRYSLPLATTGDGDKVSRSLVVLQFRHHAAGEDDRSAGHPQPLEQHGTWTAQRAEDLARRLGLDPTQRNLLGLAGRLHDEGKRADRWQRAFSAPDDGEVYAKTRGPVRVSILDGYRHEFGSLPFAEADEQVAALAADERDLVLHLIAAHHGFARPLIRTDGCEDAPPSVLEARARDVAARFFRLQARWGPWGLAWWEALLRAADQQASRDNDARPSESNEEAVSHAR